MKHIKNTLQTLKENLSKRESLLKSIYSRYPHLTECTQEEILAYFQLTTLDELKAYISDPIQTVSQEKIDESVLCKCRDSHGEFKFLYETEAHAKIQAEISLAEHQVKLKVYRCPYGNGWHLTKL